ncbi:MAG: site-specific DNA-methyltransferase [Gemmatimonadota bacterium]|nr:site-specific DNA-methyltransferase [Gemmatimonadota bacterium]
MARSTEESSKVAAAVHDVVSEHKVLQGDARDLSLLPNQSVHLIVTSPPYWTLKRYNDTADQLGAIGDYDQFVSELARCWKECHRILVPGGRLVIVVGDVCLSRRRYGRHVVMPLHASIQESCRQLGFDNLAPIIWHKIANATYEAGGGGFFGKPYEPNAIIKNDIEFILMQRKPGGYRRPSAAARTLSLISAEDHRKWFRQVWTIPGASTRSHPAPYPLELALRLIQMFSFVGDTVLDPFLGTGTTTIAAMRTGRSSVGVEIDPEYVQLARRRIADRQLHLGVPRR